MWWKLLAGAGVLALATIVIVLFGNARAQTGRLEERSKWQAAQLASSKADAAYRVAGDNRVTKAIADYVNRAAALQPIIIRSHDTVTNYAQTSAGAAPCLGADRLHGLDAFDAALFPAATPAGAGARPVPADTGAPPG